MMANEALDRLNYTPLSANGKTATPVKDAKYNSFVLKAEYQPVPHWNNLCSRYDMKLLKVIYPIMNLKV